VLVIFQTFRTYGSRGKVVLPYWTEDGSGQSGKDFVETRGEVLFLNEEMEKVIKIPILGGDSYEKNVSFHLMLGILF
jgi:solute carrier family 8 (sodium/calcium exchanger)